MSSAEPRIIPKPRGDHSVNAYKHGRCRCAYCREQWRLYRKPREARRRARIRAEAEAAKKR